MRGTEVPDIVSRNSIVSAALGPPLAEGADVSKTDFRRDHASSNAAQPEAKACSRFEIAVSKLLSVISDRRRNLREIANPGSGNDAVTFAGYLRGVNANDS